MSGGSPNSWRGYLRKVAPLVVQTYGGVCHLCRKPIDLAARFPDPRSLSIDHVVPRAAGGDESLENLRPAHLHCNTSRGAQSMQSKPRDPIDNRDWFF